MSTRETDSPTLAERPEPLRGKPEKPASAVHPQEKLPEEIEQAQELPPAEKTYPAWATALVLVGLAALGTAIAYLFFA